MLVGLGTAASISVAAATVVGVVVLDVAAVEDVLEVVGSDVCVVEEVADVCAVGEVAESESDVIPSVPPPPPPQAARVKVNKTDGYNVCFMKSRSLDRALAQTGQAPE